MNKNGNTFSAIVSIVLGLLLFTMKGQIIGLAINILALTAIILAIIDLANQRTSSAIVKGVIGICILVFGWLFVNVALYILAAAIIVMGLLQISNLGEQIPVNLTFGQKFSYYVRPAVTVLAGACLLFNQGGAIAWVFMVTGALLVIQGVLTLFS